MKKRRQKKHEKEGAHIPKAEEEHTQREDKKGRLCTTVQQPHITHTQHAVINTPQQNDMCEREGNVRVRER
jgi:hypothetical protein